MTPSERLARQFALRALDEAVAAADPLRIIAEKVRLVGSNLVVENETIDLSRLSRILVVGAGKGCARMASALEKVLGNRITEGYVNILRGTGDNVKTKRIRFNEASHPIPDEAGLEGSARMIELVQGATQNDLVICLISGGGSALLPLPTKGLGLDEKIIVTQALLEAGANINELNTVRKHLSGIKGGWLAKNVGGARIATFILSDVVGDPLDVIASGPTSPDRTTFADAINVLKKYCLWEKVPETIRRLLNSGLSGRIPETPKSEDEVFKRVRNYVLFSNRQACEEATKCLKDLGLASSILTTALEGEASQVGAVLGSIGREIAIWDAPLTRPAALVAGGETTVTVHGKGVGGRNQEVALAAALRISAVKAVAVASIGTDGVDGPTDAAGAIVDGSTIARAESLRLDARALLSDNDSHTFFRQLGDLILTGPTGTNVNDIAVIVAVFPE